MRKIATKSGCRFSGVILLDSLVLCTAPMSCSARVTPDVSSADASESPLDGSDGSDTQDLPTDFGPPQCPPSAPVRCEGACRGDTLTNPSFCGAICSVCPSPGPAVHGHAGCVAGACILRCDPGYVLRGDNCIPPPAPRPIWPPSNSSVSVTRPTFQWALPEGVDGAEITLCADRACARVVERVDVLGDRHAPGADLLAGTVYWRLRPRTQTITGTAESAVWQTSTPTRSAPAASAWQRPPDYDGDGINDLLIGAPFLSDLNVRLSIRGPIPSSDVTVPATTFDQAVEALPFTGDVDGDGFADQLVGTRAVPGTEYTHEFFRGGSAGLPLAAAGAVALGSSRMLRAPHSTGDVNGDGYADVVWLEPDASFEWHLMLRYGDPAGLTRDAIRHSAAPAGFHHSGLMAIGDYDGDTIDDLAELVRGDDGNSELLLYRGARGGLMPDPSQVLPFGRPSWTFISVARIGDADGDGFVDLAVAESLGPSSSRVAWFAGSAVGFVPRGRVADVDEDLGGAAGDINGDGYSDLVTVAPQFSPVASIRVYLGRPEGYAADRVIAWNLTEAPFERSGVLAVGVGDVTGDGIDDLAVGFPWATASTSGGDGYIRVYRGDRTAPLAAPPITLGSSVRGQHVGGQFVTCPVRPRDAGARTIGTTNATMSLTSPAPVPRVLRAAIRAAVPRRRTDPHKLHLG